MEIPEWYEATVTRQLAMTPQTWAVLTDHGVDSDTPLQLDFSFVAPGESQGNELLAFLRLETDYELDLDFEGRGAPETRTWSVVGSTHATPLTQAILEDWVRWMIAAGAEYGGCRFDGWGARVPGAEG